MKKIYVLLFLTLITQTNIANLALILREVIDKDESVRFMFKAKFTSKGMKDVPTIEITGGGFDALHEYNLEK